MTPTAPDSDELLAQLLDNTTRTLRYSRRRFLGTWLAVALLASITGLALWIAIETAHRANDAVQLSAANAGDTATTAKASTDEIYRYLKGETGLPGVPGANGKDGAPGQPGTNPPPGPPGPAGPKGAASTVPGPAGPEGVASTVPGPLGPAGSTGLPGAAGEAGAKGAMGDAGAAGVAGATGPKGDQGPQGLQGPEGISGPVGPAGPAGPQGPTGPAGLTNVQPVGVASGNDATPEKNLIAACGAGQAVVSGGFAVKPPLAQVAVVASQPNGNGWQVIAFDNGLPPGTLWTLSVIAMCSG